MQKSTYFKYASNRPKISKLPFTVSKTKSIAIIQMGNMLAPPHKDIFKNKINSVKKKTKKISNPVSQKTNFIKRN
jgi:hypothetical protein